MRLAKIILAACVWAYFVTGLSATLPFSAESSRGGAETRSSTLCDPAAQSEINFAGPWTVEFESDELHRGPKDPVKFDKLIDLSTSDDPAIKYYSGKLVYRTTFTLPSSSLPSTLSLDLGEVSVTAKVKVNGKDAGGVCFAPYRLDIAPFVKAGENDLEIEVCNLWVNRLVGDDGDPDRPTWTSIPCADKKRTKLPKSGLLGPVSIQCVAAEKVDAAKTAARAVGGNPRGQTPLLKTGK